MGLYARISGLSSTVAAAPFCAAIVDIAPPHLAYDPPDITSLGITYPLPYVQEGLSTSSYGCPCYSSLRFNPVGEVPPPPPLPLCAAGPRIPRPAAEAAGPHGPGRR